MEKFEAFAETVDKRELLVGSYNGSNESISFIHDLKLPAFIYVKQTGMQEGKNTYVSEGEEDKELYFDSRRTKHMKAF